MTEPLPGINVPGFGMLPPGSLCTLIPAEAGADAIRLERAGGDQVRSCAPRFDDGRVSFLLLNRGKRPVCLGLKAEADREQALSPPLRWASVRTRFWVSLQETIPNESRRYS